MKLLILIFLISCSSLDAKAPWIEVTLDNKVMNQWRICNIAKDGQEKAYKGFCYISKECQKRIFKDACRPKPLFCAWEDIPCILKYELDKKNLVEL
jgi:hypothetical protein